MHLSLTLGVTDLDDTFNFYRQLPGMSVQRLDDQAAPAGIILRTDNGLCIVFQPMSDLERQHPAVLQHLSRSRPGSGVFFEFSCTDLSPIYLCAQRQGLPILYELEDRQHQRRELWLQDPDGYLLIFNEESAGTG